MSLIKLIRHRASAGVLIAALIAIAPAPALACSRSGSPDPIGWSTADFFSSRIVAAAATVDLVLAEDSRPLPPSRFGIRPQATTFRVIQRIKGGSPDRFTLFTIDRNKDGRVPQPEFDVDGEGRVTPFTWLKEVMAADAAPMSSCQAGYISVERGRLYFVARDEMGRLLDQIQIYDGERPMDAFSLLVADLPSEGPWYDNLFYASQEQQRHPSYDENAEEPIGDDSIATVIFKVPMEAAAVAQLLRGAAATPFAIRVTAGALVDETRVPIGQSSESLLDLAIAQARSNLVAESDVRLPAAEALETYEAYRFGNDGGIIRWGQALIAAEDKLAAARKADVKGIVSVELAGTPAAWAALRQDPNVEQVLTGNRIGGRQYAPSIAVGAPVFTWDGIKGAPLIAKLRELAKR